MAYQAARGKEKPPVPKYHYKLASVTSSKHLGLFEKALRERMEGSGLSFFAVCHQDGSCDVMGDSGASPLGEAALGNALAVAAKIKKTAPKMAR